MVGLIPFGAFIAILAWKVVPYSASKCAFCRQTRFRYKTSDGDLVCAQRALAAHTHGKV